MVSLTTRRFRDAYSELPETTKEATRKAYDLWKNNPAHPSLHFKKIYSKKLIYSVRIGLGWRAIGVKSENTLIWFWIGSHSDYDKLIATMK